MQITNTGFKKKEEAFNQKIDLIAVSSKLIAIEIETFNLDLKVTTKCVYPVGWINTNKLFKFIFLFLMFRDLIYAQTDTVKNV